MVLLIDAEVGITNSDQEMLAALEETGKNFLVLANKVDKIKPSQYQAKLAEIQEIVGSHKVIPFSAKKKIGIGELVEEILK